MASEYILEARGLTKVFDGFVAVKNVDLRVRRGTVHALIGPNGAGKTTCFNLLTKFLEPTSGSLHFGDIDITRKTPVDIARLGMVRSFQISSVFPSLSVLENVRVALQRHQPWASAFWRSERPLKALDGRAMQLLEDVGLAGYRAHRTADLPYGRKRVLEIAATLALEPQLLLLDEPTAGMGIEDIAMITALIRRCAQRCTILLVEHNLPVVAELCDTVTVLRRGEVLVEGCYAQVSTDPEVLSAYLGVAPA